LYPHIEEYRAHFGVTTRVDRAIPQPPGKPAGARLDPIVCALAVKAATAKRAILGVCELRDGDNALVLARVLLENACLLEWLIRGDGRLRLEAYSMFMSVQHERYVDVIGRHRQRFIAAGTDSDVESDSYHRAVRKHTFGDRKTDRPTWEFDRATGTGAPKSVKNIFDEIAGDVPSFEYDVLYGALGSDIVHSGPLSLARILRTLGDRHTFVLQPMPDAEKCTIALASSNAAMFLVLDSFTQYLGLDLSAEMNPLKATWKADPYASVTEANSE
jgi:hypothetical protein